MLLCCGFSAISAQELNAKVTINSDKIQGVSANVFTTLQSSMMQMLNENRWTNASFEQKERIECNFTITINSVANNSEFEAEILITSRRPVFNSSYSTSLFNFRDTEFKFEYNQGEPLEYNENMVTSNLMGVISFYAYIIIGLDFDSFALNAGRPYFEQAMNIANAAQSLNTDGWKAFASEKNRYALALALTEESSRAFHPMWYNYHRKGLDEMAANVNRGRIQLFETLTDLDAIYQARPSSVLLMLYGDAKLSEIVSALVKATSEDRKTAEEIFTKIYPTKGSIISQLKK
ncbi:DUF4835 family protein [Dysgonomonas sp. 520]|nr:DUF4835 family protein [Dysgonomonas sp. 520]